MHHEANSSISWFAHLLRGWEWLGQGQGRGHHRPQGGRELRPPPGVCMFASEVCQNASSYAKSKNPWLFTDLKTCWFAWGHETCWSARLQSANGTSTANPFLSGCPPPCLTVLMPGMACPGGQERCSGAGHKTARMKMNLPNDPGNTQLLLHELPAACKTPGPVGWAGVMA